MGFYKREDLYKLGLKDVGENVLISKKCSIYSPENISIGNNVRIDDFCILSGHIKLHDHIHISAFCALYGQMGIEIESYSGLSPRTSVFSAMDDFSGNSLINPMIDKELTNVTGGLVHLKRFTQMGANTIVFPNTTIHEGAVTGAFTLVNTNLESWTINIGIPSRILKNRSKECLNKLNV